VAKLDKCVVVVGGVCHVMVPVV